jgi:hypothetical protein
VKDIVTEGALFNLETFIPLLQQRGTRSLTAQQ